MRRWPTSNSRRLSRRALPGSVCGPPRCLRVRSWHRTADRNAAYLRRSSATAQSLDGKLCRLPKRGGALPAIAGTLLEMCFKCQKLVGRLWMEVAAPSWEQHLRGCPWSLRRRAWESQGQHGDRWAFIDYCSTMAAWLISAASWLSFSSVAFSSASVSPSSLCAWV